MFEYKCPNCGWVIKSPTIFEEKKPCLNCDGFVELQAAKPRAQLTNGGQANFEGGSNAAIRN